MCVCMYVCPICLSVCIYVCPIYVSVCMSVCPICVSVCMSCLQFYFDEKSIGALDKKYKHEPMYSRHFRVDVHRGTESATAIIDGRILLLLGSSA